MYDYLIVGSGFFGSICAHELKKEGYNVCVIEKRNHIGGNCYTLNRDGINVHYYGPHIFHTSNEKVWKWINQFVEFNNFILNPIANYDGKLYSLPFNMWTFNQLWGVTTPQEAMDIISKQKLNVENPKNLEEQALKLVGKEVYDKLIKGYTEKQLKLNTDFFTNKLPSYKNLIYTGPIDKFFDYKYGQLEYKTVEFTHEKKYTDNFQGCAIVNYTNKDIPYTRVVEHKHFEFVTSDVTWVTYEYPVEYKVNVSDPYYPVNDLENNEKYKKYKSDADKLSNVYFGGRLAEYKYYDMDDVIESALNFIEHVK